MALCKRIKMSNLKYFKLIVVHTFWHRFLIFQDITMTNLKWTSNNQNLTFCVVEVLGWYSDNFLENDLEVFWEAQEQDRA
jgi:hypothetical protein